ncbi:amino acid ABC transporter substrate-binding protein [Vandammella animalimorsus]|uniref:Amino acid ABC transporter substrate-binding protein n=1 Tax=Vandammella animalimorsus TaxID=2029117 RepID=A0A2A2A9P7_9BURK|nr:amino acid ABC transporter substrate-binding protein [Vandammella animalimorsus]RRD67942.1 amino acid ABC transporter substrate-binding protein [Comamonadaceae bacterium OH2310_COT-174]PAT32453.1 amino acid ABC transporter substrate-binding protein [Vandammella animalimorsus]PAT34492.1 amino acid ABC transporter substrate-binding protein [Vandammella animalimorsus]PAX16337.1 amino acid ABC transporter substrate-binding protein [Vandammella animalimorsus]PAX19863.1 amino acid ABC transporter
MKKQVFALAILAAAATATVAQADTLEKIKNSGEVTLGVRESSGLGYTLGNGVYVGFHTEMAENIIKDLEKDLGKPLKIKYQPITSQNRIPLVTNGTVDFECGSTTNNRARQKEVDFAHTTYVEEVRMATKKDSGIQSVADLNNKTIAVTTGTTSVQTLRKHRRAEGVSFKEVMGKDHADSFLLLETGRADVFVMDGSILAANISKSRTPDNYRIVGEVLSVEPIACMLRKNDDAFKAAINKSIERQMKDGTLEKLWDKWFLQPTPPANTVVNLQLSESTKKAWADPNSKPMEDYQVE